MSNLRVSSLAMMGNDLFAGIVHAGPRSGVHLSRDRGATFGDFTVLPNVLDFGVHLGRLYAATERGLYERRGTGWFPFKELGETRVEQVVADGESLTVRTPSGLWDLAGARFVQRPYKHGAPRSAAFFAGALWVTDAQGVYRLSAQANDTIAAPFAGGRLGRLPDQLLLWGPGGAFVRAATDASWTELTGAASRVIPTGSARWSALMVSGGTVRIYDRESSKFQVLDVPVPARDISAALVVDGRLLLGTSGYGILVKMLE